MKHTLLSALIIGTLATGGLVLSSQSAVAQTPLGSVTLARKVLADGKPLPAGTYQVRLTDEAPKPAVGLSPDASRYVEFVKGGKVVGREIANLIPNSDIAAIAKGPGPATGGARVDLLKGEDFVRVWINRKGTNYIINMPPA